MGRGEDLFGYLSCRVCSMEEYYFDVLDEEGRVLEEIPLAGLKTIGRPSRDSIPDIEIPTQCRSASRQHATIKLQGDQPVLEDHSTLGTIVNRILVEGSSVPLHHGDEIVFGQSGDGWRVRFRGPKDPGRTTTPADPLELLVVSKAPRQIRIGRQVVEEHLGGRAFVLLKYLSDRKGNWYPTKNLIEVLWPDADNSPLHANEALAKHKKQINDLIRPYIYGPDAIDENAIESRPYRGYRMKPRLEE